MAVLDPRLLRVSIEVRGQLRVYENIAITAVGAKYVNANQGECNITLANLRKDVSDYILSETSPFNRNRTPKRVFVEAGRQSTGYSLLYAGTVFRTSITQPPDAVLHIRALSSVFQRGIIVARGAPPQSRLSQIAAQVAQDLDVTLVFEADDAPVSNYTFTGAATKQIDKLMALAPVDAFIDNNQLIVKNRSTPRVGKVRLLTPETGLVGIPTLTEQGAKVSFFYDNQTVLGGQLNLVSRQYPATSGQYEIYKLNYTLSNRDQPFYYTAECRRVSFG